MAKYTQRLNEHSNIIPSGFAGYIIRNSNVVIDKSYTQKGTTFINAFDNSNTLIKDCCSCFPSLQSSQSRYQKIKNKLKVEVNYKKFPFWFHYILNRYGKSDYQNFEGDKNSIKLKIVDQKDFSTSPTLTALSGYRHDMLTGAVPTESQEKQQEVSVSSLMQVRLTDNGYDTRDAKFTVSGTYYIDNIWSSIRSVFPLNIYHLNNTDIPQIVLNLKSRQFLTTYISSSEDKLGQKILIKDSNGDYIKRKDKYNNYIVDPNPSKSHYVNIDDKNFDKEMLDLGWEISPSGLYNNYCTHKYIAESSNSKPTYEVDQNDSLKFKPVTLTVDTENKLTKLQFQSGASLKIIKGNKYEKVYNSRYYFTGPYTTSTIAYRVVGYQESSTVQNITIKNADSILDFYFKYMNKVYSLSSFINGYIQPLKSTVKYPINSTKDMPATQKQLYYSYLENHVNNSIIGGLCGVFQKNFKQYLDVDVISARVNDYQPQGYFEDCQFLGLKYQIVNKYETQFLSGKFYTQKDNVFTDNTDSFVSGYLKFNDKLKSSENPVNDLFNKKFFYLKKEADLLHYITPMNGIFIDNDYIGNHSSQPLSTIILGSVDYVLQAVANDQNITIGSSGTLSSYIKTRQISAYFNPELVWTTDKGTSGNIINYRKVNVSGQISEEDKNTRKQSYIPSGVSIPLKQLCGNKTSYNYHINDPEERLSIQKIWQDNMPFILNSQLSASLISNTGKIGKLYYQESEKRTNKDWTTTGQSSISGIDVIIDDLPTKYPGKFSVASSETGKTLYFNGTEDQFSHISGQIKERRYCSSVTYQQKKTTTTISNSININLNDMKINNQHFRFKHLYKQEDVSSQYQEMPLYLQSFSRTQSKGKSFVKFDYIDASTLKINFYGLSNTNSLYKENRTINIPNFSAAGYICDQIVSGGIYIFDQYSCTDSYKVFDLENFLIDNIDSYGTFIDPYKRAASDPVPLSAVNKIYVQYGQILTRYNVNSNNVIIKFQKINQNINLIVDTDKLLNRKLKDLILFYDKDCIKPLYIQKKDGQYYFVAINSNGKAEYLDGDKSKTIQGNIFVRGQYKPLYKFQLLQAFQYKNQLVQDWFNIDTYVNCSNFLNHSGSYSLNMNKFIGDAISGYQSVIVQPKKSSFSSISYINTDVTTQGSSVKLDYPYSLAVVDNLSGSSSSLSNLFSRKQLNISDNQQFAYKLFSFNFKIPKNGWDVFSQEMYKKNENFGNTLFIKSSLIDETTTPINKLKDIVTSQNAITSGYFSFIYMVLNSRTAQQIVGNGNYGTGYYSAPSSVIYDPKNPGVIIGYEQNKIQGAYSAAELKNTGVQYDGVAEKQLDKAYKSHYISIPYIVKLSDSRKILNIVSQNQTLSFSEDIQNVQTVNNSKTIKRTLTNICVTQTINSVVHNIIIPKLEVIIMIKYRTQGSGNVLKLEKFLMSTYVKDVKVNNSSVKFDNINFDNTRNNVSPFIESLKNGDPNFKSYYNSWLLDSNNLESFKYYLRNIGIIQDLDQNSYPYAYLPMITINFGLPTNQGTFKNSINNNQSMSWKQLSGYIPSFSSYKPIITGSINYIDITNDSQINKVGLNNENYRKSYITNISQSGTLIDAQQFVMPADMSTNLFYYKSSDSRSQLSGTTIKDEDQAIIINARKMYSQIEDLDTKPMDSKLILGLSKLQNVPITLTALIKGNQDQIAQYFNQVNVAVTSSTLTYEAFTGDQVLEVGKKYCRYTDANSQGIQWNLFKLNENVTFSAEDIQISLKQEGPSLSISGESNLSGDQIKVPVNLSMNINGLIFQQQCRYGVSFDNINKVSFDQRVFDDTIYSNVLKERFNLKKLGETDMPSAVGAQGNFYLIRRDVTTLSGQYAFGGSQYYNDFYNMKVNSNSANKWKTYTQESRFSKLLAYPDYNPTTRIVGTPYFNSSKLIEVKEKYYEGSQQSICKTGNSIASVAKIAEDKAYINNINVIGNYENYQKYPSASVFDYSACTADTSLVQSENILLINVNAFIKDASYDIAIRNTGIKAFNLQDFTNISEFKISGSSTFEQIVDGGRTSFAIYFDGFNGQKEVFIYQNNSVFIVNDDPNKIKKQLEGINPSYLKLYKTADDRVGISGIVALTVKNYYSNENNTVQIHNFKMPAPTIQKIGVTFTKSENQNLVNGRYYLNSTDLWRPGIVLPKSYSSNFQDFESYLPSGTVQQKIKNKKLYSSSQPGDDFKGNSTVLTDDSGAVTGLLLTLSIPGIRLFDSAGIKFFLESRKQVVLSSQQMVKDYHLMFKDYSINGVNVLSAEYNTNAVIGTAVVTGVITNSYNYISSKALSANINVGKLDYTYNPQDDNKFQLEVITKQKNKPYSKILYYINMPVDKWYNMAFYKYVNSTKSITSTDKNIDFGFILSNVNADSINDITANGQQIFECQVANDAFVKGTSVKFKLTDGDQLSSALTGTLFPRDINGGLASCMKDWKSMYTIEFDKCLRTQWDCKYSADYSKFSNEGTLSVDQWQHSSRKDRDLFRIGDTINSISFTNPYSQIKIFANSELNYILGKSSKSTSFYDLTSSYIMGKFSDKIETPNLKNDTNTYSYQIRERLLKYYPYKFLNSNDSQNYVLIKKNDTQLNPIIKAVAAEASNIMFVSSPNFNYEESTNGLSGHTYVQSYSQAISTVNQYKEFFNNPQHRLPPVSYERHILSSDYATLIYNNTISQLGINDPNYLNNYDQTFVYDYSKSPSRVSFVWGNSQVTKIYSLQVLNNTSTQLSWNKAAFTQYQAEEGSVYNFKDSNTVTNSIIIETGSINQRQCVLMPVITSPLEYQKRSEQGGLVKVTQSIIATSALGYSKMGQPRNGILTYNTNGCVEIDSKNTNYIYLQQNGNGNECVLKATVQKPVYVEAVCDHNMSLSQKYLFLQNPDVSQINNSINGGSYATSKISNTTNVNTFTVPNNSSVQNQRISQFAYHPSPTNDISGKITVKNGNILTYFNKVGRKPQLQYKYQNGFIELNPKYNLSIQQTNNDVDIYFANPYAIPRKDDVGNINIQVLNVFADEDYLDSVQFNVGTRTYESTKCFGYDGKVIQYNELIKNLGATNILDDDQVRSFSDYSEYDQLGGFYKAPMIGVLWGFNGDLGSKIDPGSTYYQECLSVELKKTGVAYCDQFRQHNISGVKFKISQNNFKSAPIFIRIELLKYDVDLKKFEWKGNDILNLDIRDTYQQYYNYDSHGDAFIEWDFIDDQLSLCKNTFGIRFIIEQIVPQDNTFNSCKIDNIQIFTSNYLNKYGMARAVEDVFVRKADANYADSYSFSCSEYIWRLPNSRSEWQNTLIGLQNDESFVTKNAYDTIAQGVSGIIDGTSEQRPISSYLENSNLFDQQYSYYIAAKTIYDTPIQILSDNYLVKSNIQISWKYVDYVYIYYSCYSFNAKQLLDMYFGDKIYNIVRNKLVENVQNMNSNSLFAGKYKFRGGVAVQKQYQLNTTTKSQVFEWKSDVRTDITDTYQDVYVTNYTKVDQYKYDIYQTDKYASGHGFGGNLNDPRTGVKLTSTFKNGDEYLAQSSQSASTYYVGTLHLDSDTQRNYLGSTLQNTKYMSVDNWTKSFTPRQLKFKIN